MQFPTDAFNPELRHLMARTLNTARLEIDTRSMSDNYRQAAEAIMALRLMTTITAGERDPHRLTELALQAVDGRHVEGQSLSSMRRFQSNSLDPIAKRSRVSSELAHLGTSGEDTPRGT